MSETRLDINPAVNPDVVASLSDMGEIGEFDLVYSAHCLEHLYPHDVAKALREMYRVTKEGGKTLIIVPDLEDIRPTEDVIYVSPSGPICGLDLIYGQSRLIDLVPEMAHHSGFVASTLHDAMEAAGFVNVTVSRDCPTFNLIGAGTKHARAA